MNFFINLKIKPALGFLIIFCLFYGCITAPIQDEKRPTHPVKTESGIFPEKTDNIIEKVKEEMKETPKITKTPEPAPTAKPTPIPKSTTLEDSVLERMGVYLKNGSDRINYGAITEGIKQLVAVLAEYSTLKNPSDMAKELANEAEIRLTKIKASMSLGVDPLWQDKNLNQIEGSSVDISPQPAVILTVDMGMGRSLVADAPIVFQFTKGSGTLTTFTATNDYGQASCKILSLDNPLQESVIQASLFFKEKDFIYKFDGLERNFVYVPPANRAVILVLEKSEVGVSSNPIIYDVVYRNVSKLSFTFTMYNGIVDPKAFEAVYNGDLKAIKTLGLEHDVTYMLVAYNDCFNIKELLYNGVGLGMFYSEAKATLRIIRISDAKIIYETSVIRQKSDSTHGQGGSKAVAAKNVLDLTALEMDNRLKSEIKNLGKALTGK